MSGEDRALRERRVITRRQLRIAFHGALACMQPEMQEVINAFGEDNATSIAPFMIGKHSDPYDALDCFVAARLETGCIKYAHAKCAECGTAAIDFSDNSIFTRHYSDAVYKIVDFLRDSNCELARAILERKIELADVAPTNILPLCPSIMRAERADIAARREQKIVQRTSSAYPCPKCAQRLVTLQEQQFRRPDEPPALVISCTFCNHTWIMK